jgi:hypothetical protein
MSMAAMCAGDVVGAFQSLDHVGDVVGGDDQAADFA